MNACSRRVFFALMLGFAAVASAQEYPVKPVRLIVPYPPGGGADIVGRLLGEKLGARLGQQVVIENMAGANGMIAAQAAARSAPDGYTLLLGADPIMAINPGLYAKIPYDPVKDFDPVSLVASITFVLVVHPELPARSVQELIALARSRPGQLSYVSIGAGSQHHLGMELFKTRAGVDLVHVPYKGSAQYLPDLLSGRVPVIFTGLPPVFRHIQEGKLRALAVGGAARSPSLPEVPTVAESGLPGYEMSAWFGVFAPAGTAPGILARLNREVVQIVALAEVRERLAPQGAHPMSSTPQELAARIKADLAKWMPVIKASGARAE